MNAEKIQVGGNHYKGIAYEPARFGFDAGLESLGTQIAKYLVRDKGSRIENLEKAYHCIALDQMFDEEWKLENDEYSLDVYYAPTDEKHLEKYFSQFSDCEKLKSIMRFYMKAEYPTAKRLLRRYINGLKQTKTPAVGAKVRRVDNELFSKGRKTATVRKVDTNSKKLWIEEGGWLYFSEVKIV